jgi:hypothetical protein
MALGLTIEPISQVTGLAIDEIKQLSNIDLSQLAIVCNPSRIGFVNRLYRNSINPR